MMRALVIKALTEQILLLRSDSGEILSLTVHCGRIPSGSILVLDADSVGCHIKSINGKCCTGPCKKQQYATVLDYNITEKAVRALSRPTVQSVNDDKAINQ